MLPSLPEEETTQLVHNEAAQQKWKLRSTRTSPPQNPTTLGRSLGQTF